MPLDDLLEALKREGRQQSTEILAVARNEADAMERRARDEAVSAEHALLETMRRQFSLEARAGIDSARTEARRKVLQAWQEGMGSVRRQVEHTLGQLRSRGDYPALLRRLAEEASEGLEGPIELRVHPDDVPYLPHATGCADIDGGVHAVGVGMVHRNGLRDRLDRVWDEVVPEIVTIVTEDRREGARTVDLSRERGLRSCVIS